MLIHGFEYLDPTTGGPLPSRLNMIFFSIVYRARKLLVGRSRDDIAQICAVLNKISDSPSFQDPTFDMLRNWDALDWFDPDGKLSKAMPVPSDVGELVFNLQKGFPLKRVDTDGVAQWHELFAVLALSFTDKAVGAENPNNSKGPRGMETSISKEQIASEVNEYAVTAIEAVTVAEGLVRADKKVESEIEARLKNAIRDREARKAREAALKRHEPHNQAIQELVQFWNKGTFRSVRQAVSKFIDKTPQERFHGFSRDNLHRFLYDALRGLLNGKRTLPGDAIRPIKSVRSAGRRNT